MLSEEMFKPLHADLPNLLLVVEDSEGDFEMLLRSVKKSPVECQIHHYETGREALDYLFNRDSESLAGREFIKPSLILLDLNLPGIDGKTVLNKIKLDPILKMIPVVIFSTSSSPRDIKDCYAMGANAYVIKPMDVARLERYVELLLFHWFELNVPLNEPSG